MTALNRCLLVLFLAAPGLAWAAEPAALVEDISGKSAGVQFMDYVSPGRAIRLAAGDTLVLSYLKSCRRETITGGVVTVGTEESAITGGKVEAEKVDCDPGKLNLTTAQAAKSGTMVFRSTPGRPALPAAEVTLHGLSPMLDLPGGGKVSFERLDQAGGLEFDVGAADLVRGSFYDLARHQKALAAGGLYRVKAGGREVVVKVSPQAKPGAVPLVSRLLRLAAT